MDARIRIRIPSPNPHSGAGAGTSMSGWAATGCSQRLAHSSTFPDAGRLNGRVRDGYGCLPAAVAARIPTDGLEPSRSTLTIERGTHQCRWASHSSVVARHHCTRAIQLPPEPVLAVVRVRLRLSQSHECDVACDRSVRVSGHLRLILARFESSDSSRV